MVWALGGIIAAFALRLRAAGRRILGHGGPRPKMQGVPFAAGSMAPRWPIALSSNSRWREVSYLDVNGQVHGRGARRFVAPRSGGARRHAGIDLFANGGDTVVAPESGVIFADQNFLNTIPGDDALLLRTDSGLVLLFGEIVANSYRDFGLRLGDRVTKGRPIARVGVTSNGSHMLHFETYRGSATRNYPWFVGKPPPAKLLDPTDYLLRARSATPA